MSELQIELIRKQAARIEALEAERDKLLRETRVLRELLNHEYSRTEELEAALQEIIDRPHIPEREQAESVTTIARAALASEQDK